MVGREKRGKLMLWLKVKGPDKQGQILDTKIVSGFS